jgi:inner membrane protein
MTGHTHFVAGIATLALPVAVCALARTPLPVEAVGLAAVGAAFGALAPDLDAPASLLRSFSLPLDTARLRHKGNWFRPFALTARLLNKCLGHRGLLHSAPGFALAALAVVPVLGMAYAAPMASGFVLGYLSHLALDASTVSGIPLWHPKRRRHLFPVGFRVTTGSVEEGVVFALACVQAFGVLVGSLLAAQVS